MMQRTCEECGAVVIGRSDKRFCSDQCRSSYSNRRNREPNRYVRKINATLRKNRRILDSLNPGGRIKVTAGRLKDQGFDFRYFTSTGHVRDEGLCYFCYDQGYVPLGKNYFLLVLGEESSAPIDDR